VQAGTGKKQEADDRKLSHSSATVRLREVGSVTAK